MLWIRIGFNLDLDSAFYLSADPDQDSQIKVVPADPDPGQTLKAQKVELLHEKYRYPIKTGKKHTYEATKAFLKGRKPGLFINFGQFPCSRIRIPNFDPDPGHPNEAGSGSTTLKKSNSGCCRTEVGIDTCK